jgi:hypothetical protein
VDRPEDIVGGLELALLRTGNLSSVMLYLSQMLLAMVLSITTLALIKMIFLTVTLMGDLLKTKCTSLPL